MKKVERNELLDYVTYSEQRDQIRKSAIKAKDERRIELGDHLTFLFENTETIRYQIQEMMRTEQIVKEQAILHEMETYNDLLGPSGVLGCTLLIQYSDPKIRDQMLVKLVELPKHLYLKLDNDQKSYASFDPKQMSPERLSSVQFLKFECGAAPTAIGCDHPEMMVEAQLSESQKQILDADLKC